MKPILCFLITLVISLPTYAQKTVEPLSSVLSRINLNKLEPSEIAYIGTRCSALYTILANFLEINGELKNMPPAKEFKSQARDFLAVSLATKKSAEDVSQNEITNQFKAFVEYYVGLLAEIKSPNNSVGQGISADIGACRDQTASYSAIAQKYRLR